MTPAEIYSKIRADRRMAASPWPVELTLGDESFEIRYDHHGGKGFRSFALVDRDGVTLFSCNFSAATNIGPIEADILSTLTNQYSEHFSTMDERRRSVFLQIKLESSRDVFETWSWKDRAVLIQDRIKYGLTPEEIDRVLGKPEGYTLALEDLNSDPRLSEIIDYQAGISAASFLKGLEND